MKISILPRSFGVFPVLISLTFLVLVFSRCEKDPIKGWDYFIDAPPHLEITATAYVIKNCVPPYPVTFYQEVKNKIGTVSYYWEFGDGTTSTSQNPTHIYTTQGEYKVMFVVSNEISSDTAYFDVNEVKNPSIPINTKFSYSRFNNNFYAPNKVVFYNESSGTNIFHWQFGDGKEDNDDEPTHIFKDAGLYTVKLRGTCTNTDFHEYTQQIQVLPAPTRVYVDSINLMLPSTFRRNSIFIEMWHNNYFVGRTVSLSISSFPFKFMRDKNHFINNQYFFDMVAFTANEVFKFMIFQDMGEAPPVLINEILLSSKDIQNNFYSSHYYKLEPIPAVKDLFIDLYISY